MQNFGGPVNDNFPEGLFPPGLLSKEDIEEIRKQQEKEAREAAERERQQQQNQQQQGQGQDYEDGSVAGEGGDGSGDTDENTVPHQEGDQQEGITDDGTSANYDENGSQQPAIGQVTNMNPTLQPINNHVFMPSSSTAKPPAYHNAYQPIQPLVHQSPRVPLQPSVDYASHLGNVANHNVPNRFNFQPEGKFGRIYGPNYRRNPF